MAETVHLPIEMYNTGSLPLKFEWAQNPPFYIVAQSGTIPIGCVYMTNVEFRPKEARGYEGQLYCRITEDKTEVNCLII